MSLIVANVCKDGIVLTSDKRATGTVTETGESFTNDYAQKTFLVPRNIMYGFAGERLERPIDVDAYVQREMATNSLPLRESALKVFTAINAFLDILNHDNPTVLFLAAGYHRGLPVIYTIYRKDQTCYLCEPNSVYGSVGLTEKADEKLRSKHLLGLTAQEVKEKHQEAVGATAKAHPQDVSSSTDSHLITPTGIIKI